MYDKFTDLMNAILSILISIGAFIYGCLNYGDEHTSLYFGLSFVCAVLSRNYFQNKQKEN